MLKGWLSFFLLYAFAAAVPAFVLFIRGRGWRPKFYLVSLLISWTGGGWMVMLWIAVSEQNAFVPQLDRKKPPV